MAINRMLVCGTLALCCVGAAVGRGDSLARAGEKDSRSGDATSPGGTASTHPTGDDSKGEELYNASCIVCHGTRANGGIGPRLAGNPVLSDDQAFWKVVHEGRHMMPPLKGAVTDQQLADIRAWLKTLQ